VPNLGGKIDAIPGSEPHVVQGAAGTYIARCAELCGVQHALMTAHVHVVPRSALRRFIAQREGDAGQHRARQGGVRLRLLEVPPARHEVHRPGAPPQPAARTTARGSRRSLRKGVGLMPAVGSDWTTSRSTR
jgi:cytochrome c oxidase subunit 2